MAEPVARRDWSGGINNRADWRAMPAGTVRDSVNFDPKPGPLTLRSGYTLMYPGTAIRGALAVGEYILLADGPSLIEVNTATNSSRGLKPIAPSGRFSGAVWNNELFFCTENETLRFKDGVLRSWGVQTVSAQPVPSIVPGALPPGPYWLACTFVDAYGDEGGTTRPLLITVPPGGAIQLRIPPAQPGGMTRLYVGSVNGETLYKQYQGPGGDYLLSNVRDDSERLTTAYLRAPVVSDFVAEHNGMLLMAEDKTLWHTVPFQPHLRSAVRGFYQFPASIDVVISADSGVFVAADKTYYLTNLETDQAEQAVVLPYGAVRGSAVLTPDNRAAWMTRYGIAKSDGTGKLVLPSAANFVPQLADTGSSGIVERNGAQLVVTTLSGLKEPNPLAMRDYYEAEITYNE